MEKGQLKRNRQIGSLALIVVLVAGLSLYKYSTNFLRLIAYGQWNPPKMVEVVIQGEDGSAEKMLVPRFVDVASLGVEALEPIFIGMIYVCFAMVFSTLMAAFMAPQLNEHSFGQWSRFATVWLACFFGFVWVVAGLL